MLKTLFTPAVRHGHATSAAGRGRAQVASALLLGLVAAAIMLIAPALASADTSSTLTVIGTSDVSDSGLIPNVIQPGFEKAYPAVHVQVHRHGHRQRDRAGRVRRRRSEQPDRPRRVAGEPVRGRRLLLRAVRPRALDQRLRAGRPNGGPGRRGRQRGQQHRPGVRGRRGRRHQRRRTPKATFVSRGGTPGTTVSEHGIWQLVSSSGLSPAGLLLCTVSAANGGGETPIAAGHGVTASGQACPGSGALPTGRGAADVVRGHRADPGAQRAGGQRLQRLPQRSPIPATCSPTAARTTTWRRGPIRPGTIPALKIVSQDNSANAPGGQFELINYFHGYIINPSKPGQTVNLPAAQDFLNYITSPTVQAQVAAYLQSQGTPFKPTASPLLTSSEDSRHLRRPGGQEAHGHGNADQRTAGIPGALRRARRHQQGRQRPAGVGGDRQDRQPGQVQHQLRSADQRLLRGHHQPDLEGRGTDSQSRVRGSALTSRDDAGEDHGSQHHHPADLDDSGRPGVDPSAGVTGHRPRQGDGDAVRHSRSDPRRASRRSPPTSWRPTMPTSRSSCRSWARAPGWSRPSTQIPARSSRRRKRTIKVPVGAKPKTSVSFSSVKVAKRRQGDRLGHDQARRSASGATIEVLAMKTSGGSPTVRREDHGQGGPRQDEVHRALQAQDRLPVCAAPREQADRPVPQRHGTQDDQRQVGAVALS